MNQLKVEHISKSYQKVPILVDISIHINQGEVVGLLGPNGAGKTTCFSIISGLIKTDGGKMWLCGEDITYFPMHLRARAGIGYLPQESSIFRGLSVADNLRAVLELKYKNKDEIEQKIEELLAEFSISHLRCADSIRLSGGERRRVEIARAIANDPKFLMLDEPLAGIDPIAIDDIKSLITHLKEKNIGILITDHNVRETLDIIDRGYVIYDRKVLIAGSAEEIKKSPEAQKWYFGNIYS
jgi:lipopolysaccharide export system ATP-binding protein